MKNLPEKLRMNALKVKAVQDPNKKGAEKPDLGAPGIKKKAKLMAMTYDPKNANVKKLQAKHGENWKKELAMKRGIKPENIKEASIDDQFDSDMRQIVGIEGIEKEADWERPDVSVADQITDRIDDHYLVWMQEQSDKDVVKAASSEEVLNAIAKDGPDAIKKAKKSGLIRGGLAGAAAVAALAAAGGGGYALAKRKKTAGVIANPENEELLARLFGKKNGQKI